MCIMSTCGSSFFFNLKLSEDESRLFISILCDVDVYKRQVIGQVEHISVDEEYAQGYEKRYGKDGFMMLVPAPQNLKTGDSAQSGIATIKIEKLD